MDTIGELKADGLQRFQQLVRVLRWDVDVEIVGILLEESLMHSQLASFEEGHLD